MSVCLDDNHPDFLPLDVIAVLEAECRDAIVSRPLAEARPSPLKSAPLCSAGIDLVEAAVLALSMARGVWDARPTRTQRHRLHELLDDVEARSRIMRTAIGGAA